MSTICTNCGNRPASVTADARALGLEEEFRSGLYNCCQITRWADEQSAAWLAATLADREAASAFDSATKAVDSDPALVYVRKRRQMSWRPRDSRDF